MLDGVAQRNDFVGNVIFGAAMNNLGISQFASRLGGQLQAIRATRSLDDSRDQNAIGAGFGFSLDTGK